MRSGYASVVLPVLRPKKERQEGKGHLKRCHTQALDGSLSETCQYNERKAATMEIPWCKHQICRLPGGLDVLGD